MPVSIMHPQDKIPGEYVNDLIDENDMVAFQKGISEILNFIKENPGVKENPVKYKLIELFSVLYKRQYKVAEPPSDYYADLLIYDGIDETSPISVIIETKRPDAPKNEMIYLSKDKKSCDLNVKAFHELIGYYLDFLEMKKQNPRQNPIRHLIATNGDDWFIFPEDEFHKYISKDKEIHELHTDFKKERFYLELAEKNYLYEYEWHVIHFKLTDYVKDLTKDAKTVSKAFFSLYKLLSPYVLLGKKLPSNEGNVLNKKFYRELLHIMGLFEVENDDKKLGLKKRTIHRLPEDKRESGSLIENTLAQMREKDINFYEHDYSEYGENHDEQKFNIALDLCLTWLNRILFIKLLEGQLLRYGKLKEKFMTWEKVSSFNEIDHLFFKVFKYPVAEREAHINEKYANIPYLNSSLFDKTTLEEQFLSISNLDGTIDLAYYPTTVLTKDPRRKINGCRYLLEFLDKYDFASDQSKVFKNTDNDKLINASVLGLIFEKINAYADGAVFTPGLITSYICRETIRRAVVKKFNESELPGAGKFETIADIRNTLRYEPRYAGTFSNNIINSLRICDPAVGSGHFLVSALNELILIKSELGILQDINGRVLDVDAQIVNDELIFIDERGNQFRYEPDNWKSQIIQQTIFNEKLMIITKCLYGVDLNPKSVSICRLRLWIELLKHAYYKPEHGTRIASNVLQVLPNIDINIRCGNSLISHYPLNYPYAELVKSGIVPEIDVYRKSTEEYRLATDRTIKMKMKKDLDGVANRCKAKQSKEDALKNSLTKYQKELSKLISTKSLTEWLGEEETGSEKKKQITDLKKKVNAAEEALKEYLNNEEKQAAFSNAFEWRLAFPDILDENGEFVGFDCVIGNPPYIQLQKMNDTVTKRLYEDQYESYVSTGDIYCLFYEQGRNLLKENGILGYITSNKWMRDKYGQKLRKYFVKKTNPIILIDLVAQQIFEGVTVEVNILLYTKEANIGKTQACNVTDDEGANNLNEFVKNHSLEIEFNSDEKWILLPPIEKNIQRKIQKHGIPLKNTGVSIYRGILTGYNPAFVITNEKKDELISQDSKLAELIHPLLIGKDIKRYASNSIENNAIVFPTGFTNDNRGNQDPESFIKENYPSLYTHFMEAHREYLSDPKKQKKSKGLILREDKGDYWWELRSCAYLGEFSKQKMVWKRIGSSLRFLYDEGGAYSLDSTCFATGENMKFLVCLFNSKIGQYLLKDSPKTGVGDLLISVQALEPVLVPQPSPEIIKLVEKEFNSIRNNILNGLSYENEVNRIDDLMLSLYDFSPEEKEYICEYVKQHFN